MEKLRDISDEFLRQILSLFQGNEEFLFWAIENIHKIEITHYQQIPEIKLQLDNFLKNYKPKSKNCYLTAWRCCVDLTGIEYVEGYYIDPQMPLILDHAWNLYNDKYFDLTTDIVFKGRETKYYQTFVLPKKKLLEYSLKFGKTGTYLNYHFLQQKKLKRFGV